MIKFWEFFAEIFVLKALSFAKNERSFPYQIPLWNGVWAVIFSVWNERKWLSIWSQARGWEIQISKRYFPIISKRKRRSYAQKESASTYQNDGSPHFKTRITVISKWMAMSHFKMGVAQNQSQKNLKQIYMIFILKWRAPIITGATVHLETVGP